MKKNNLPFLNGFPADAMNATLSSGHTGYPRQLFERSPYAIIISNDEGVILETNPAAAITFDYAANELRLLNFRELINHNDDDILLSLIELDKKGNAITEAKATARNGKQFPVEISMVRFYADSGQQLTGYTICDISERKIREADLRLSNERYDMVVKATNDLVWDWDLVSGDILRNSYGIEKVYGHPCNDDIRTIDLWARFLHPEDRDEIMKKLEACKHNNASSFSLEYRFMREDGSYAFILDRGYILRNDKGEAIRMIGAAEDITKRKEAQKAVEESESRYKMFVQQSREGIWRVDIAEPIHIGAPIEEMVDYCYNNAWIAECNDAFARMYGFANAGDIIGIPLKKLLPPQNPENREYLTRFFSNGLKITDEISYETDADGREVVLLNNMTGIVEGEYSRRAWGVQRDITEQVKLENRLKEERLLRQQQISEAFVTGQEKERQQIGEELHDNINQILATTKLYLECMLAEEKPKYEMLRDSKLLIDKAMAEIRNLSRSLLPPSLGEIGLLQAIDELVSQIQQVNSIDIEINHDSFNEYMLTDKLRLTIFRIIQEQINNILRHAAATRICISLQETAEDLILVITDNGNGFNTAVKKNGVGIRNIISRTELNGGEVNIQSAPGAGCELTARFPVR